MKPNWQSWLWLQSITLQFEKQYSNPHGHWMLLDVAGRALPCCGTTNGGQLYGWLQQLYVRIWPGQQLTDFWCVHYCYLQEIYRIGSRGLYIYMVYDLTPETPIHRSHSVSMALYPVTYLKLVKQWISVINTHCLAWGVWQTGSGKTHTMLGDIADLDHLPSDNRGMTPRVFETLFAKIQVVQLQSLDFIFLYCITLLSDCLGWTSFPNALAIYLFWTTVFQIPALLSANVITYESEAINSVVPFRNFRAIWNLVSQKHNIVVLRQEEEVQKHEKLKFKCRCSFLEIYNEQITDLLEPSSSNLQVLIYKCDEFGCVDNKLSVECLPLSHCGSYWWVWLVWP